MAREFVKLPAEIEKAQTLNSIFSKRQLEDMARGLNKLLIKPFGSNTETKAFNNEILQTLKILDLAAGTNYAQNFEHPFGYKPKELGE